MSGAFDSEHRDAISREPGVSPRGVVRPPVPQK